jgi:hypothetical protein
MMTKIQCPDETNENNILNSAKKVECMTNTFENLSGSKNETDKVECVTRFKSVNP